MWGNYQCEAQLLKERNAQSLGPTPKKAGPQKWQSMTEVLLGKSCDKTALTIYHWLLIRTVSDRASKWWGLGGAVHAR